MAQFKKDEVENAKTISGPHSLFKGSFILEFLEPPPSLNATVLMRGRYPSPETHPLNRLARSHPQSPPLHLHFDQSETFLVTSGVLGTTETYSSTDHAWTPSNTSTPHEIAPWVPHTFWPHPTSQEDCVFYIWAHPTGVVEPMDRLFFENLLLYLDEVDAGKASLSLAQVMVTQHASASALVMFPTAWWLGPIRWWLPWKFQGVIAMIGRWMGYRGLMEKYTSKEDWEEYLHAKRA